MDLPAVASKLDESLGLTLVSAENGLAEFLKDLGDPVTRGEVVARIHPIGRTGQAPFEHRAALDGLLAARHFPGLVQAGDCLAVIAIEEDGR